MALLFNHEVRNCSSREFGFAKFSIHSVYSFEEVLKIHAA